MSFARHLFSKPTKPSRVQSIKARALKARLAPAKTEEVAEPPVPVGRRGAARLRLSIPANFVSLCGTHRCILIDLSSTGAQLGLEKPLQKFDTACLQIAGQEIFCEVVRSAQGPRGGINGVVFDPPLDNQDVLAIRRFAENYEEAELRRVLAEVKSWVQGVN